MPADTVVAALGFIASIGPLWPTGAWISTSAASVVDTTMATNNPGCTPPATSRPTPEGPAHLRRIRRSRLAVNNAAPTSIRPTAFSQVTVGRIKRLDTSKYHDKSGIRRRARG